MKTESNGRRGMTASDISARVIDLAPEFLHGLAPDDVANVLQAGMLRRFPARSIIATEGHPADEIFLILYGRARAFTTTRKGEKVLLLRIPPGDPSGGRALLARPTEYLVSTEAVTDCSALVWSRSSILLLTKKFPILLENALMIASEYFAVLRDLLVAASHHTASERIAQVLANLSREMGRTSFEGTVLNVSNEDLANEANVTIFTVSRTLGEWQRKGLVVKRRGQIVVRSPAGLAESLNSVSIS
jgi:CRP/FNR family transcriptional regulator, nitrogen oxide reductase regulator